MSVSMKGYATTVIWLTSFSLPYLLFAYGRSFRCVAGTVVGAIFAIGFGWIFVVAYAIAANAMNTAATQHTAVTGGDGAALAFSALFGWIGPAFVVGIAWIVYGWAVPSWSAWTSRRSEREN